MNLTKLLRTSAAALGALAVATGAHAADIYTGGGMKEPAYIPPPLWTGFYIGAHIGAAWDSFNNNNHNFFDCAGSDCSWTDGMGNVWTENPAIMRDRFNNEALAFGGAQLGYNWQWTPTWVLGIEVDLGGMSVAGRQETHGNTTWTSPTSSGTLIGTPFMLDGNGNQGGFYGDVTGRIGYTWGTWMLYAKGGFAWVEANNKLRESVWDGTGGMCGGGWCSFNNNNNNDFLTGWTAGGGIEWKVSPAWSIKAEYLHFEFNNNNNNCCNDNFLDWNGNKVNNIVNNNNTLDVDTVKLGFNYFWNPAPPAPLK